MPYLLDTCTLSDYLKGDRNTMVPFKQEKPYNIYFSAIEAKVTAKIRKELKQMGQPIGFYDLLIAGTAVTHDLILVTSNLKEFAKVKELKIENWRSHFCAQSFAQGRDF